MRVQTGCRDCALCTGNSFTGIGRVWGRIGADAATLGLTYIVRKKCKGCGHPMIEHGQQMQVGPVRQQMQPQQPLPPMMPAGWYPDAADTAFVVWWDGQQWYPESRRHYSQVALQQY